MNEWPLVSARQFGKTTALRAAEEWEQCVTEFAAVLNRSHDDVRTMLDQFRKQWPDATPGTARTELQKALARFTPATLPHPERAPRRPPQPTVKDAAKRKRRRAARTSRRNNRPH